MALQVLTIPLQHRETEEWKKELLLPIGVGDKQAKLPTSHFCAGKMFL